MTTAALVARTPSLPSPASGGGKGGVFGLRASLSRNRRWALITSYVFLMIFAIFFLIPP
jgi:hypothetical protein